MARYIKTAKAQMIICDMCNALYPDEPCPGAAACDWRQLLREEAAIDAADVAPVIRCRDCKYWGDERSTAQRADGILYARCRLHSHNIGERHVGWAPTENDFCSCGERKDGGE